MSARITVVGNVASVPQLRQTSNGRAVANFRVGSTERHMDRESGTWVDGSRFFVGVACWGTLAENVVQSIKLGTPVVVTGRISQRQFSADDQTTRFYYEINADSVAPDLAKGTATFTRGYRSSGPAVDLDADGAVPMGDADAPFDLVNEHNTPWTNSGASRDNSNRDSTSLDLAGLDAAATASAERELADLPG